MNNVSFHGIRTMTPNSPAQFYLHIGPHKTGTTTIQTLLERNETQLYAQGIRIATIRSQKTPQYQELRSKFVKAIQGSLANANGKRHPSKPTLERLMNSFREFQTTLTDDPSIQKIIISDENLLGPITGHRFAKTHFARDHYAAAPFIFQAAQTVLGDRLKCVCLGSRPAGEWLSSSYKDYISKLQDSVSPLEFRQRIAPDFPQQFEQLYQQASQILGPRFIRLDVSPFAKQPPGELLLHFMQLNGIALQEPANLNLQAPRTNSSLKWRAIEFASRIGHLTTDHAQRRSVLRMLNTNFDDNQASPAFMAEVASAFQ